MTTFIDAHRDEYAVEPICKVVLQRAVHKVDHGSGGTVPLRRSKTPPIWEPFLVMGRGGVIPRICIAKSVRRAETG